ncbi:type II secretion system F family protein [Arthrobacter sp. NEB 688]|uniref:type II secretion system F family protein n=1 Tax=Arthrobacter sp. NEB 688 TaxID=904039 RepID=UPI002570278F|nr:type II secretion system F family protein [Arthrobacter sp. NEB 688]
MLLVALMVALAALLTARARGAPWPRRPRTGSGEVPRSATVEEAATALGLLAAVVRGGGGVLEALETVARVDHGPAGAALGVVAAAHRWGEPTDRAWARVGPGWAPAAAAWHAAASAGAPPADLVEHAAGRMRAAESRRVEAAGARAGVLLVLPLGLCFLPGFVATTVVPVVLSLLSRWG